ncbi:acyl-CoA dehydrogenase family protein [Pseudonocardia sp. KRD-184]|uniref:Acyl-CoA dehydrogenase family protein n=1 Tax=Pseudonocardia oceani TaxID=2792013 RepID=A0ABS6U276_9PSEU|nr:acyl-CoA dehydrogenase family protein [Pseudonocardia oceani]MBW0095627.1 acyl-CoA dehydrogenase family protein [Pseudonocardia oceani]MBW0107849.1 acyl-CoA dehydrogenase family protein [Pseudonocardia oceani]MBW0122236.1 acyl-CoA dehydrogenase family protein [Pseudonocardia oceani]MBW0126320.1 acyl-CoA dehydrogenase family protein [Pseudonocardia oceani]
MTEREREWVELGRRLAAEFAPRAARWDTEAAYPEENHARLRELGLLGAALATAFGGGGASLVECYLLVEEISKACANTALLVHDQNVSGRILAAHGGPGHREILERLAAGTAEVTIAMTEPQAGSLCYRALSEVDAGRTSAYHSACAKIAATEGAFRVVDDCLQMLGGAGYFAEAPLERMLRDVRMFKITGGTTQILKNTIGRALVGRP